MFTGIVEEVARIAQVRAIPGGKRFRVEAACTDAIERGDSVSLNGICLTAEQVVGGVGTFAVSAIAETLRRTTAGAWRSGSRIHLERALAATSRLGGHLVQGHVDGMARVMRAGREGCEFLLVLQLTAPLRRYVVSKGSLAVNGVSLTVGDLRGGLCRLHIIPETLDRTLIGSYRPGERVNLEVDIVAKYVEALTHTP